MNAIASPQPNTPTIILVGGPFTADTGEQLDSRQPFADDPLSDTAQTALAGSELWWLATVSVVMPLLHAQGEESFALISGLLWVVALKPDGTVRRRRLAPLLPGGLRPAKTNGKWKSVETGDLRGQIPGQPLPSLGGPIRKTDAAAVVETTGWFWRDPNSRDDYAHFEKMWLTHHNLIIVAPHTHDATVYLDGYVDWVTNGRHENAPAPPPMALRNVTGPTLHAVLPVEADFRVTAVLQSGMWVDPAPLEAARSLLQARFDLKLGIWDLVTNHTLRATLLKETPVVAPPSTPAAKTSGALERRELLLARRTDRQKRLDTRRDTIADLMASLDAQGWTNSLPGVKGDVDPAHRFRRSLLLAVAPDCDDTEARVRHPALRSGKPILWLQLEISPDVEFYTVPEGWAIGGATVILVIPPPLSSLDQELFSPFFEQRHPDLDKIAGPNSAGISSRRYVRGAVSYKIADFEQTVPFDDVDWAGLISSFGRLVPAWVDVLAPLAKQCREAIAANPRLGCS
jgi:hypothetical protein